MIQITNPKQLYEQDILLWVEDTVAKLRARDFEAVDWEHVIEEIEALGISEKRELVNRLSVLLEHILKRRYVYLPENYRGWENTVREQRRQLRLLLENSPSLKSIWQSSFDRAWQLAIQDLREEYPKVDFPDRWQDDRAINTLLEYRFWD